MYFNANKQTLGFYHYIILTDNQSNGWDCLEGYHGFQTWFQNQYHPKLQVDRLDQSDDQIVHDVFDMEFYCSGLKSQKNNPKQFIAS